MINLHNEILIKFIINYINPLLQNMAAFFIIEQVNASLQKRSKIALCFKPF